MLETLLGDVLLTAALGHGVVSLAHAPIRSLTLSLRSITILSS